MEGKSPQRVLIAMDGSVNSEYAFKWYLENCHAAGNRVIVIHCPEYKALLHTPIFAADPKMVNNLVSEEENRIKLLEAKIKEQIKRSEVDGKFITACGEPGHAIIKTAKEQEVDFIVTGSRGLGTVRRTFMGSVSDFVVHHSHVPVLIAHHHQQQT